MMTDPIADMLTRIRNAGRARHAETSFPHSKMKLSIAQVLQREGFLSGVRVEAREGHPVIAVDLRYDEDGDSIIDGIVRRSKPGRRVYVASDGIPAVRKGLGIAVLSTSKGVLSDRDARAQSVGGELLCEVW
jgi:small subunit ribosomal protein S8